MTYTLMHIYDANACVGLAEGTATVIVNDLPTAVLESDNIDACSEDIIELNIELTGSAPWNLTIGDGADEHQDYELTNANETIEFVVPAESMNLQVISLSDDNECIGSGEGTVALNVMATPDVDLGIDTVVCQDQVYILDAQNEGATYSWSTGEETQTIEVDQSMADANGDAFISVEVTSTTGCTGTDEVLVHFNDCTGIDELNSQSVQLLPNPNNGRFVLELSNTGIEILNIAIHNSIGEVVAYIPSQNIQGQTEIDLSYLADGVYFLVVNSSKNSINKRFIIRK
jgi:hypothetical protein